jgi:hypothetical protein
MEQRRSGLVSLTLVTAVERTVLWGGRRRLLFNRGAQLVAVAGWQRRIGGDIVIIRISIVVSPAHDAGNGKSFLFGLLSCSLGRNLRHGGKRRRRRRTLIR